jgi:hypothetical protein
VQGRKQMIRGILDCKGRIGDGLVDDSIIKCAFTVTSYTIPDLYFPPSGNVLDGSIGLKSPYDRQVQGWHENITGQVEIARPDQLGGSYSIPRRRR